MHSKGVCHRDIKPDNILVNEKDYSDIKLIDFNTCTQFLKRTKKKLFKIDMTTVTGTLLYKAPELFQGGSYDQSIDMWAVGVITYELLSGQLPFFSEYYTDTIDIIIKCNTKLIFEKKLAQAKKKQPGSAVSLNPQAPEADDGSTGYWDLPEQQRAKDFVSRLLKQANRLTPTAAKIHPWLAQVNKITTPQDDLLNEMDPDKNLTNSSYVQGNFINKQYSLFVDRSSMVTTVQRSDQNSVSSEEYMQQLESLKNIQNTEIYDIQNNIQFNNFARLYAYRQNLAQQQQQAQDQQQQQGSPNSSGEINLGKSRLKTSNSSLKQAQDTILESNDEEIESAFKIPIQILSPKKQDEEDAVNQVMKDAIKNFNDKLKVSDKKKQSVSYVTDKEGKSQWILQEMNNSQDQFLTEQYNAYKNTTTDKLIDDISRNFANMFTYSQDLEKIICEKLV